MKLRLWIVILTSFLVVLAFVGCEPKTKHKVLTFFFDGVPPLETPKPEETAETQTGTSGTETAQSVVFTHKPYQERKCDSCHEQTQKTSMVISMAQTMITSTLCFRCHEDNKTTGKVIHAPVAGKECLICHDPHQSGFKYLLPSSVPDLCFNCHDQTDIANVGPHALIGDRVCTTCHNPHSSNFVALLVFTEGGQICFDCHQTSDTLTPDRMTHKPAKEGECFSCHVSHTEGGETHLVREGKALCDECHEIPEKEVTMVHAPVATEECQICHDPHGFGIPANLVKELPELCWECHDEKLMAGNIKHAAAEKGGCPQCHSPHGSKETQFLLDPVPELCLTCHDGTDKHIREMLTDKTVCTKCHSPHSSSDFPALLISTTGGQVCFNCHESSDTLAPDRMTHGPAKAGKCFGCHVSHTQGGKLHLIREGEALCSECHEIPENEATIVHAPVATGECQICHNPHGSRITPNLVEELPELCWECHDEKRITRKKEHIAAKADNIVCTECHSPHSSVKAQLLK